MDNTPPTLRDDELFDDPTFADAKKKLNGFDKYVEETPRWRRILQAPLFFVLHWWWYKDAGMALVLARFTTRKVRKKR